MMVRRSIACVTSAIAIDFLPFPAVSPVSLVTWTFLERSARRSQTNRRVRKGKCGARSALFLGKHLPDSAPCRHAVEMRLHLRKAGGIDPIAVQPSGDRKQVRIADRILCAHHP